jgi:transcriptional regulator with XRE-family HTH domain
MPSNATIHVSGRVIARLSGGGVPGQFVSACSPSQTARDAHFRRQRPGSVETDDGGGFSLRALQSGVEPSSLGELLRRYRMAAGLTQEELAERAGLSGRGVQDLERGLRRSPHADTRRRLAEALGLTHTERAALFGAADSAVSPVNAGASVYSAPLARLPTGTVRTNLPRQLTPFIGRDSDVGALAVRLLRPGVPLASFKGSGPLRRGQGQAAGLAELHISWRTESSC